MTSQQAKKLLKKYNNGTATKEERNLLESWFLKLKAEQQPHDLSDKIINNDTDEVWLALKESRQHAKSIILWPRIAAAASILVFLSVGGYFLLHKKPVVEIAQNQKNDIAPGGNKAILKSHGKTFSITDAKSGLLAQHGSTLITKTADGQLAYQNKPGNETNVMVYDTLIIPRGGQYKLKLADGSIAYLNADTKIRYPESFSGKERLVELISGEMDLQVKHNSAMPFKLIVKGQEIHDIGTEFNVNAYDDEPAIKTTLLEGSIKVSRGNRMAILTPGQQATTLSGSNSIKVENANTEQAVAWKNGFFEFNNADIQTVMRQLSRWYDVEVRYEGKIPAFDFSGEMERSLNASQALKLLSKKVRFRIEGKKIIVTPN